MGEIVPLEGEYGVFCKYGARSYNLDHLKHASQLFKIWNSFIFPWCFLILQASPIFPFIG